MTKNVRIENADTSDHPDGRAQPARLGHPTAMTERTIWRERRIVIEEGPVQAG